MKAFDFQKQSWDLGHSFPGCKCRRSVKPPPTSTGYAPINPYDRCFSTTVNRRPLAPLRTVRATGWLLRSFCYIASEMMFRNGKHASKWNGRSQRISKCVLPWHSPGRRLATKNHSQDSEHLADIRTGYLPNGILQRYCDTNIFGGCRRQRSLSTSTI
jgi:hypothetical protein